MRIFIGLFFAISLSISTLCTSAQAKSTFLPDWQEADIGGEGDYNKDENYCIEAEDTDGSKFYHKATSCPAPKVFDEYCPTDGDYISKCYCDRTQFPNVCTSPYRGDTRFKDPKSGYANCDDFWYKCCDTTCPAGYSRSFPGGCPSTTTNGCGDTCYGPYAPCCTPYSDEGGCECGSYDDCDDGCGGLRTCCYSCPEPEPTPPPCTGCECDNSCNSSSGGGYTPDPTPDPKPDPKPTPKPDPAPSPTPTPKPDSKPDTKPTDPCAGTSCPTSVSCGSEGCATYSSKTSCCSSVCTKCNAKKEPCPTGVSCPNGCLAYLPRPMECPNACASCKPATPSCNYSTTASQCASQCASVGSSSCTRNGTTYYSGCGTPRCKAGYRCVNGTCSPTNGGCAGKNCKDNDLSFADSIIMDRVR